MLLNPAAPPVASAKRRGAFKTGLARADVTRMEYVSRCPACSSLVRPGQDWCTLCHADLRPPQLEAPAPMETPPAIEHDPAEHEWLPEPSALLLADRAPTQDQPAAERPILGKHARHAAPEEASPTQRPTSPVGGALPEAEISQLFAQLAAESPNPLGGVMHKLPDSQGMRVLLALTAGSALAVLLVAVSWILGLIFG